MLRPIPLRRYLVEMTRRGFDAADLLRGSGITRDALEDPHYMTEISAYLQVVDNVIRLTGDTGIGFDMGLAREASDFRILGYASMVCRTVRQSIQEYWSRYGDAFGMMVKIALPERCSGTETADVVVVRCSREAYRFLVEEALCVLLKVGAQVSGTRPHFERLHFAYPEPPYSARYKALFACPMVFNAENTQISLSRAWLDQPLRTMDSDLLQLYQQNLEQLKRELEAGSSVSERLRQIFLKLGNRIPPMEVAGQALALSPRTLRRRLQQEGLCYRGVAEALRVELAIERLKSGPITAKQLSDRVGFSDVNAFRRAFKRWTGQTVNSYRQSVVVELT